MDFIKRTSLDKDSPDWTVNQRINQGWQEVADALRLTFLPGQWYTEALLFGVYRGCRLDLAIGKEIDGDDYIRLTASPEGSAATQPEPSKQTLWDLLTLSREPFHIKASISPQPSGRHFTYQQPGAEYDTRYLRFLLAFLSRLSRAYPAIAGLRAELGPSLQAIARCRGLSLQPVARQLLLDMGQEPGVEAPPNLNSVICQDCLAPYESTSSSLLPVDPNAVAACPVCGKRQGYFAGIVEAVLDQNMGDAQIIQGVTLRVNWLKRRTIFDFDRVSIAVASDEEVERFAVQVGNDTDSTRQARYKVMACLVSPGCALSENTRRILGRTFGTVEAG